MSHGDAPHEDVAHQDDAHDDVAHEDVAHEDVAHGDSPHEDVEHEDVHADHQDTLHVDADDCSGVGEHGDHSDGGGGEIHCDFHDDVEHEDVAHVDDAHADTAHEDVAHEDDAHDDVAHEDVAHNDTPAHEDVPHDDVPHEDTPHGDHADHTDVPHEDHDDHGDHSDGGHTDEGGHDDVVHDDHTDAPHVDDAHVDDAHIDEAHGDANLAPEDMATDLESDCLDATMKVANKSLSHLGISQRLDNLAIDPQAEADMLRLHWADDVEATLRDFPWPFATRYVEPTLVDGAADDPVNGDWTFSYRVPDDCVFVRRILHPGMKREYDPNPIQFRIGSDDDGLVIYTDQEDATIEYTFRPVCPAGLGDALFREALSWRLASHLAPSQARNKLTSDDCMKFYGLTLAQARQAAANESQRAKDGDAPWHQGRN